MLNNKKQRLGLIIFLLIMMTSVVIGLITNSQDKEIDDLLEPNNVAIKQTSEKNVAMIEPTVPERSLEQSIGADMVVLDYASDGIVIFHGYFGLFVYDLDELQIIRSLDLKPLNCTATQGDDYCEVTVSKDGNTVQLHCMSSQNMYVYTVSSNTLQETTYERMNNRFSNFVPIEDVINSKQIGNYSYNAVKIDTDDYGYLNTYDWRLSTLSYVRGDMVYRLFDINESDITLDDLQNTSIVSKEHFFEETYPLFAKIGEKEIYLYGQPNGAALRVKDHIQLFDWILTTPRFILPRLFTNDVDKDGTEEIICILNVGSGTGVAIDELHILKQTETDNYEDFVFEDCVDQLAQLVSFEYVQGAEVFTVSVNDTVKQFALLEEEEEYTIDGFILNGSVIMYDYDEGVTIEIPIGIRTKECASLLYTGINVKADVDFYYNKFYFSNLRIVEEEF